MSVKLKIYINSNLAIPPWGFYPIEIRIPIQGSKEMCYRAAGSNTRAHANDLKMSVNTELL